MRVRILFRDYEISDLNKQQLLYGVAVLISILSVFSIIFMLSYYSEDPLDAQFPSPTPGVFSALTAAEQKRAMQQQVKGVQQQMQPPPQRDPNSGPQKPSPKPSPSPSPSPTITPTPTPTPTATPASSPSPTPEPSSAPAQPAPSAPSNLQTTSGCDGSNVKVVLTWSSTSGASSYKVFRDGSQIKEDIDATAYTDTSVSAGNLYAYSVKAKNSVGDSPHSDSKTITPQACPSASPS